MVFRKFKTALSNLYPLCQPPCTLVAVFLCVPGFSDRHIYTTDAAFYTNRSLYPPAANKIYLPWYIYIHIYPYWCMYTVTNLPVVLCVVCLCVCLWVWVWMFAGRQQLDPATLQQLPWPAGNRGRVAPPRRRPDRERPARPHVSYCLRHGPLRCRTGTSIYIHTYIYVCVCMYVYGVKYVLCRGNDGGYVQSLESW